jgi:hypothetical protein
MQDFLENLLEIGHLEGRNEVKSKCKIDVRELGSEYW